MISVILSLFINYEVDHSYLNNQIQLSVDDYKSEYKEYIDKNYFKGESVKEIGRKIEKYFNSSLNGKGEFVARYSVKIGLDPYLAAGVMLQETGCYWKCSYLTRKCNNVGGQKGKPSCGNSSYRKFDSLDDGLKFTMKKLNSYYKKGYTTAKKINPFYAEDKTWYKKVNNYMKKIKGE